VRIGAVARALCVPLAAVVLLNTWPVPAKAQDQEPTKLNISILEGEGSINNIRQRVAREAIVQVDDQNHKPVAGVAVTFFLPEHGAGGLFSNGSHSLTVMTDNTGRAVAQGIVPNKVSGEMQIRVVARYKSLDANTVIHQQNGVAAGATSGAISGKVLAIILISAAGVAGGVVAATRGGNGGRQPSSIVTITVGTPVVGAPH